MRTQVNLAANRFLSHGVSALHIQTPAHARRTYTLKERERYQRMVSLVVATTADPASIGPAAALLAMPGWQPGPSLQVTHIIPNSVIHRSIFIYVDRYA